jgi:hypothetical protein
MNSAEQQRFNSLYKQHITKLKRQSNTNEVVRFEVYDVLLRQ